MMLVGPMKKKLITTVIVEAIILLALCVGVVYYITTTKNAEIQALDAKTKVHERYVLTKDFPAGHILDVGDLVMAGAKAETIPHNSFELTTEVNLGNKDEIYRITGINYNAGEVVNNLELLMGRKLSMNVSKNTILTDDMLVAPDGMPTDDLRLEEFSMITIPSDTEVGDYIDVRILFPTGVDYSVLIGKKVEKYTDGTIFLNLTESEILTMGSAIIEPYIYDGTSIYATKYVDPDNQLYDYKKVDYVAKYKDALEIIIADKKAAKLEEIVTKLHEEESKEDYDKIIAKVQESSERFSNLEMIEVDENLKKEFESEVQKAIVVEYEKELEVDKEEITNEEIAKHAAMIEYDVEQIRNAIDSKNEAVIERYENKVVASAKSMISTYPINQEAAKAIQDNWRVLDEVKANFDLDKLVNDAVAEALVDYKQNLWQVVEPDEYDEEYKRLVDRIKADVQKQKDERIKYLESLIQ